MKRRLLIRLSLLGLGVALAIAGRASDVKTERNIVILFTGDIHGHLESWQGWEGELKGRTIGGFDRLASAVQAARNDAGPENVLLLDSGDALGDSFMASETKGMAVIEAMNAIGYDAISVGNHEPDFGAGRLKELMNAAAFPFVAANIRTDSGELLCKPFVMREFNGINVAVLGFGYPNTPLTTAKKNVEGLVFEDPRESVHTWTSKLRSAGADLIIALTHYGLSADLKLAKTAPNVDVIIGGHSHNRTREPVRVGKTIIMHAGAHCSDLGKLVLTFSGRTLAKARGELITLDHSTVPSHRATAGLIHRLTAPFDEQAKKIIATAEKPIIRAQTLAGGEPRQRDAQSPADSLFADIIRQETGSDIALLPGVGYGVAIPAAPITQGALRNLIPHESKVVKLTLTGEQIIEILQQSLKNTYSQDPSTKVGGMIQVSGLEFWYDPHAAVVQRCTVGGKDLDPSGQYAVATNSMLAEGGHNYRTFLHGLNRREYGAQFAMIKQWMAQQGTVKTPTLTRTHQSRASKGDREQKTH